MKLTKLFLLLASSGVLLAGSEQMSSADSVTAPLAVGARVKSNCTITTTPVGFPDYDPTTGSVVNSNAGSVNITCSKGAVTPIELGLGSNASGSQRQMKGPGTGGTEMLKYELFSNSGRTNVWGTGTAGFTPAASTKSTQPVAVTVYGQIAANQDVSVGDYSDSVVATVNF